MRDFHLAKRKAAQRLGIFDDASLPRNREIEDALREYQPGDDLRHVHWKSTAKTGRLMVRQYEESRRSRMAVVLGLDDAEEKRAGHGGGRGPRSKPQGGGRP